jgi:hypothetical protein
MSKVNGEYILRISILGQKLSENKPTRKMLGILPHFCRLILPISATISGCMVALISNV